MLESGGKGTSREGYDDDENDDFHHYNYLAYTAGERDILLSHMAKAWISAIRRTAPQGHISPFSRISLLKMHACTQGKKEGRKVTLSLRKLHITPHHRTKYERSQQNRSMDIAFIQSDNKADIRLRVWQKRSMHRDIVNRKNSDLVWYFAHC